MISSKLMNPPEVRQSVVCLCVLEATGELVSQLVSLFGCLLQLHWRWPLQLAAE